MLDQMWFFITLQGKVAEEGSWISGQRWWILQLYSRESKLFRVGSNTAPTEHLLKTTSRMGTLSVWYVRPGSAWAFYQKHSLLLLQARGHKF